MQFSIHQRPVSVKEKERGAHGKHNNTNGPAVDEVVIALDPHAIHDNFGGEVVRRPAHGLFGQNKTRGHTRQLLSRGPLKQRNSG